MSSTVEKPRPVRRARNAAATRAAIIEAASALFSRDGYDQVGVREIAADAGIDPALVNRYFGSKEGLLVAVLESLVDKSHELQMPPGELGPAVARRILLREGQRSQDQLNAIDMAIRSNSPNARAVVRDDVKARFVAPIAERLGGGPDAEARAHLFSAIMMGVGVMRGLLGESAASRPYVNEMIAHLAPILDQLADPGAPPIPPDGSPSARK